MLFCLIFAWLVAIVLLWIAFSVGLRAIPAVEQFGFSFVTGSIWTDNSETYRILAEVLGTIVSSMFALLIAFPIGLGVAIFLSEDYLPSSTQRILVFLVELLAAIPSIVFGFWGLKVLVPVLQTVTPLNSPAAMLPAAMVLAVMILPTITAISRDAMINVPDELRAASYGVGATRWETILQILIPAASSGIIGGVMLALGRALGETMAVTILIGNSNRISFSLLDPAISITARLANQFPEASPDSLAFSSLMYAAFILFALTLAINIIAQYLVTRIQKI